MTILASTTALAMAIALFFELRRDLMMLHQNSYRNSRYMQWLRESGDSTSMSRLCILIIFFVYIQLQIFSSLWALIFPR